MVEGESELRAWIEAVAEVSVTSMARLGGGGSREAWDVDAVTRCGSARPLFLRRDLGVGPVSGTELSLAREAAVIREMARHGIPVSEIVAVDSHHDVVLAERADGTGGADFVALLRSPRREEILDDFIDVLARLHNLDPEVVALAELDRPGSPEDHALLEVARWRRLFEEKTPGPDPVLVAAFDWLERHPPSTVERTVVVHGDCGPGNFLFVDDHVSCVVDWEFTHFGDPMDDIAWLGFRQDASGELAFTDLDASLARWSAATGLSLDPGRIAYYGLLVLARCATCAVRGLANAGATIDNAVWHRLQPRVRRAMAHQLADLHGVTPDPLPEVALLPANETTRVLATLQRDLVNVIQPDLTSEDARKRSRSQDVLLQFLVVEHRLAPLLEELEVADVNALLGTTYRHSADALAELVSHVREAGPDAPELVRYLCRRTDREALPWIVAGLLPGAERPFPALYRRNSSRSGELT